MEYREDMTNDEYIANFKCCKNCPEWDVDIALGGDYAYNTCRYWLRQKNWNIFTPWALFCEGYRGLKTLESPDHKLILNEERTALVKESSKEDTKQ